MRAIGGIEGALRVAGREMTERRVVLVVALFAGVLPFMTPILPGLAGVRTADARDGLTLILAPVIGVGLALLLGATAVGRDLGDGRLSFDFSRPLPAGAIWGGRFLGALALTLVAVVLVLLPTSLVGGGIWSSSLTPLLPAALWALLGAIVLGLPLGHAVSVAVRSRSAWLAVDFAGLAVFLLIAGLAARRLYAAYAEQWLGASLAALAALAVVCLWASSALQVAHGRTDLRRGHRVLSLSLWGALLVAALVFQGWSAWVLAAGPGDLRRVWVVTPSPGDWVEVSGEAAGRGDYLPSFLLDVVTGEALVLGPEAGVSDLAFSADGRHAAWFRHTAPGDPVVELHLAELTAGGAVARPAGLTSSDVGSLALSDAGGRVAVVRGRLLSVFDTGSGAVLASARLPGPIPERWRPPRPVFVDRNRVRLAWVDDGLRLVELDVAAGRLTASAIELPAKHGWTVWDRQGDRLAVVGASEQAGLWWVDAASGETLAALVTAERPQDVDFQVLADGRIAVAAGGDGVSTLRLFSPDGAEQAVHGLGARRPAFVGGEIEPGRLVVGFAGPSELAEEALATLAVVDLGDGAVSELGRGLYPLAAQAWWTGQRQVFAPGSAATRLFIGTGELLLLDPATGAFTPVAGRREPVR